MNEDMKERLAEAAKVTGKDEEQVLNDVFIQNMSEMMMIEAFVMAKAHSTIGLFAEYLLDDNPPHNALLESIVAFTLQCIAGAHEAAHELLQDRLGVDVGFDEVRKAIYMSKEQSVERSAGSIALKRAGIDEHKFYDYVERAGFNEFLRQKGEQNG